MMYSYHVDHSMNKMDIDLMKRENRNETMISTLVNMNMVSQRYYLCLRSLFFYLLPPKGWLGVKIQRER